MPRTSPRAPSIGPSGISSTEDRKTITGIAIVSIVDSQRVRWWNRNPAHDGAGLIRP